MWGLISRFREKLNFENRTVIKAATGIFVKEGISQEVVIRYQNAKFNSAKSYYNLDLSVRPSVPHLLGRLWTDCIQTWQEGQGRDPAGAKGMGFHGNQTVVMVFNKKTSCTHNTEAMILKFTVSILISHVNQHAKNERNPSRGS